MFNRKPRKYRATFWIGNKRERIEFRSTHFRGTEGNRLDAIRQIRISRGYVAPIVKKVERA